MQHAELMAVCAKLFIRGRNLRCLTAYLLLINTTSDLETLCVVCDGNVFILARDCRVRHSLNRALTVTPDGMHLQIAFYTAKPRRLAGEDGAGFGERQKSLTYCGTFRNCGRVFDPAFDEFLEVRADSSEFGHFTTLFQEISRFFAPKECSARGPAQSLLSRHLRRLRFPS